MTTTPIITIADIDAPDSHNALHLICDRLDALLDMRDPSTLTCIDYFTDDFHDAPLFYIMMTDECDDPDIAAMIIDDDMLNALIDAEIASQIDCDHTSHDDE